MTSPADIFQGMEKDQYFSKIDLSKGYWQILVRKEDIPKMAFVTMDCHYKFLRMPFGMMNSEATLISAVKKLLCGMDNVVDYIDDLLIHTETWEAHVKTRRELFKRLQEANFTARPVKCLLGSRTVDFLGHSLGRSAIGLQDENIEKVRNAPRPKTKREVRAFLGLAGYYKEFVPNFAAISTPLSDLLRKGQPNIVNWGDSQERAYNSLRVAVTSKPVLQLPHVNKRFILRTDAADRRLGVALMQENEGTLFPAVCCSDGVHCCPAGYTCDVGAGTCNKGSDRLTWLTKLPSKSSPVQTAVTCDDQSECPSGNTCCLNQQGGYSCCPLPSAVCCSDRLHCCPAGYTCDVGAGTCNKGSDRLTWLTKLPSKSSPVQTAVTCDAQSECPSGNTCCLNQQGGYSCCPLPSVTLVTLVLVHAIKAVTD
ncbi:Cg6459 pa [Plakobranchus ocellatus]|uniref:Cg6459 pa n=1 Tax=Plakobranchus ocellatus TaxID=259542 RepID=A0AAV4DR76_9GAST|nr:Cg6459 pa [Plakobranchus ocellatus]